MEWTETRWLGQAHCEGRFANVYESEWISRFRTDLAPYYLAEGFPQIDASVLMREAPRSITQQASRVIREDLNQYAGIHYPSRFGLENENRAVFLSSVPVIQEPSSGPIDTKMPQLAEALEMLGLRFSTLAER